MCSSELPIEHSLYSGWKSPISRSSAHCSKDIYWFDLPVCLAYIFYPLLTHSDCGSSCFHPRPSPAQWHSQLFVQPHTYYQESLEQNFSLRCQCGSHISFWRECGFTVISRTKTYNSFVQNLFPHNISLFFCLQTPSPVFLYSIGHPALELNLNTRLILTVMNKAC